MWSLKKQLERNKKRFEARNKKNFEDFIKIVNRRRELLAAERESQHAHSE